MALKYRRGAEDRIRARAWSRGPSGGSSGADARREWWSARRAHCLRPAAVQHGGLYELKIQVRNGWSAGAVSLALHGLIADGTLEIHEGHIRRPPS